MPAWGPLRASRASEKARGPPRHPSAVTPASLLTRGAPGDAASSMRRCDAGGHRWCWGRAKCESSWLRRTWQLVDSWSTGPGHTRSPYHKRLAIFAEFRRGTSTARDSVFPPSVWLSRAFVHCRECTQRRPRLKGIVISIVHEGGCLCGDVRYKTLRDPVRVTICHCPFCQRFTGFSYLVEPIFRKEDVVFEGARAKTYEHHSDSSGKRVTLNFCGRCATTLYLDLERFPDILGLCAGAFDDPNWFDLAQGTYCISSSVRLRGALSFLRAQTF